MRNVIRYPLRAARMSTGFLLAATAPADAQPDLQPVAVSSIGVDPFANCTADFPDFQPGTLYSNGEVEPSLAVNPLDKHNLIGVWQQDRWSNAGSRGIVAAASFDGGSSWTAVTDTKTSVCTGGTLPNGDTIFRTSNAWTTFGPDGTAYLVSLAIPFFGQSAVLVSTSRTGGLTWSDAAVLQYDVDGPMNDKPTITADPHRAGVAYVVWNRNEFSGDPNGPDAAPDGPAWFARTLDGGHSWEPARKIFDPGPQNGSLGHQIVVLPSKRQWGGELVDVFEYEYSKEGSAGSRRTRIGAMLSDDAGVTWSGPVVIDDTLSIPVVDPFTGATIRTGSYVPDVAMDPRDGTVYAVWLDARFSGGAYDEIALSMSTDGGLTWTEPTKANRTPVVNPGNAQAFTPSVHVAVNGTLAISYYDLRRNGTDSRPDQPLETDRFIALCPRPSARHADRCASGWTEERITPRSFDLRLAPNAEGLFIGGYQGLTSIGDRFITLFAQAGGGTDPASIYFSAVRHHACPMSNARCPDGQ